MRKTKAQISCATALADQHHCFFRCTDRIISLVFKSEISSLQLSSVAVQPGLCLTWSKTPNAGFCKAVDFVTGSKMLVERMIDVVH